MYNCVYVCNYATIKPWACVMIIVIPNIWPLDQLHGSHRYSVFIALAFTWNVPETRYLLVAVLFHSIVHLKFVHLFSKDVDECKEGTSSCEFGCVNTVGSYTCSCLPGYVLNRDGKTCRGTYFMVLKNQTFIGYSHEIKFMQRHLKVNIDFKLKRDTCIFDFFDRLGWMRYHETQVSTDLYKHRGQLPLQL